MIPLHNVFRNMENEGIRSYFFMEDLYCKVHRREIITKSLVKYTKRFLDVLNLDCHDALDLDVHRSK